MALRFIDGFEHYAIPSQIPLKYTSYNDSGGSSGITTMTGRRAGSTALLFRISSDFVGVTFDAQATWVVGFGLYMLSTETAELMRFVDSDGTIQAAISIGNDGTVRLYRGSVSSGTLLATSSNALPILGWNFIEAKLTIADSGGTFEVRVNESVWVTFTGDTKQSSTQATAVRLQIYGRASDNAIDDLYICDGTGSVNNTYLGDIRVDTVRPIGAGNYAELSRQGSASNWDNVDDTTIDSDSSYNYSNTVGQRDNHEEPMNPSTINPAFDEQEQENTPMTEPEYFRAIGRLEAHVQTLTTAITELKTKVDGMDTKLADLDRMANRWKGGFAVVLALGAICGALLEQFSKAFFINR